jgi:uncharacterized membrane protein YfcA
MDSAVLLIFLVGTLTAAFVTGLAGFAFGAVAAAVWLHALPPAETTTLIVTYALLVQGYAVWKLRHALDWERLWPLVLGSALGIPAGGALLQLASPSQLRVTVGVLLILFALYNLWRPNLPEIKQTGRLADGTVGLLNGILGAATGLAGILPMIWCGLRGWSRDEQRAVFQPTAVATFLMIILWFGGTGTITADAMRLFAIGLPALALGTALGWALYGKLNEAAFRRIVLVLLLISGLFLVLAGVGR